MKGLGASQNVLRAGHVAPMLGATVDDVLREFVRASDEWCGLCVVEAVLPVTNAGPSRRYRVQAACFGQQRSRIGVALESGLLIRQATAAEEEELEECLALGFVQIESKSRIKSLNRVLHQATGRKLGMPAAEMLSSEE
ncbi:hypothetical protein [Ottowia sp.]|uniref:hypothetical protein n=1 Tax=Ottowia sp. TaxID=1898956 RepID=UPI0025D4D1B5|nr:hypothetical protein [Ottowia sp.]MBK6616329.1 hypothetical protein [Ottowia sp.]